MTTLPDAELMEILKGVSRSFVLTIRALPSGLRRPIGIAYLLARASDTIADTATAPIAIRSECLRAFVGNLSSENATAFLHVRDIHPPSPTEQHLIENLDRITAALRQLPASDREQILTLLQKITRGQELDILRFQDPATLCALTTAEELDEYTYLVAGCVGEFWTRICSAHIPRYGCIDATQLCEMGRHFGQGLQLVNILRDIPEDIANGRCYLPLSELRENGITDLRQLSDNLPSAAPVFETWRRKALQFHEEARRYIESIRPLRIRFACLIPWALGVRTLKLIGEKSPLERRGRVKVSRREVTRIMRRAVWGAMSNGEVRRWGLEG